MTNRYDFDEEFLVSFSTRATAVKEDLRKATDDPFLKESERDLLAHRNGRTKQGILAYLPEIQDIPPAWKTSLGITYSYSPELLWKKIQSFLEFTNK